MESVGNKVEQEHVNRLRHIITLFNKLGDTSFLDEPGISIEEKRKEIGKLNKELQDTLVQVDLGELGTTVDDVNREFSEHGIALPQFGAPEELFYRVIKKRLESTHSEIRRAISPASPTSKAP